ncbi:universal stress protein, partial [Streptomyces sp. NPDC101175]
VVAHILWGRGGLVVGGGAGGALLWGGGRRPPRRGGGPRIGSVAHGVLHHAGCPVAVVPPQETS